MERICVYTCVTGNYDNLHEIKNKEKGIDYYCFTNNKNLKSDTWKIEYIEDEKLSNVELARKTKILGHKIINEKYDILVWIDGAVVFKKNIKDFVKKYLKENDAIAVFKHGERNSIHEEANACFKYRKESKEKIKKILDFYKKDGYEDNNGLVESTVFIKRTNNELLNETMNLWFDMILKYSTRDQLSFNYAIYKTGLKVKWINEKVFSNSWFDWIKHRSNKTIKGYRVYFGDELDYNIDNDIQGEYAVKGNEYSFKITVPNDTDYAVINITDSRMVSFSNVKINNLKKNDFFAFNCIKWEDKEVFYNDDPIIKIEKPLKKGSVLNFSIEMENLEENEIDEFINYISRQCILKDDKIEELRDEIKVRDKYIKYLIGSIKYSPISRLVLKIKSRRKDK